MRGRSNAGSPGPPPRELCAVGWSRDAPPERHFSCDKDRPLVEESRALIVLASVAIYLLFCVGGGDLGASVEPNPPTISSWPAVVSASC